MTIDARWRLAWKGVAIRYNETFVDTLKESNVRMKTIYLKNLSIAIIVMAGMLATMAHADRDRHERDGKKSKYPSKDYHYDKRYHHDRYYPRKGVSIKVLPSRHYRIHHHDSHYYFSDGIWYRPSGGIYVVVRPPIGLVVPILPVFYTTIWLHGVPYYYANDIYYVWRPDVNGYVVTNPPTEIPQDPVPLSDQLYIYPKKGQSEKQQADDRYTCHRWGVEQTGYDPTKPPAGMATDELSRKREDYQRAMRACLEGKDYSVR